jgi:urea transport system permease protein
MPKKVRQWFCVLALCVLSNAYGLTPDQAKAIAVGEGDARIDALRTAIVGADERTVQFIQALSDDAVKLVADKPVIVKVIKRLIRSVALKPACRIPLKT